jgi:hypothetical protein
VQIKNLRFELKKLQIDECKKERGKESSDQNDNRNSKYDKRQARVSFV